MSFAKCRGVYAAKEARPYLCREMRLGGWRLAPCEMVGNEGL